MPFVSKNEENSVECFIQNKKMWWSLIGKNTSHCKLNCSSLSSMFLQVPLSCRLGILLRSISCCGGHSWNFQNQRCLSKTFCRIHLSCMAS